MNNEDRKKLIDKYLAGESNAPEEEKLRKANLGDSEGLELWFKYLDGQKKKAPKGFNEALWEASPLSRSSVRKLLSPIISVAASIALLLIFILQFSKSKIQNYEEKQRLWEEAMLMVDQVAPKENKDILYKDDLITISIIEN